MNSPVRLGVSPTTILIGFYSQKFGGFFSPPWNLGLCGLSSSAVVLLVYPHGNVGPPGATSHAQSSSHHLAMHPLPQPPFSTPPTLKKNVSSVIPWLLDFYTVQVFWQIWLFFVFKFVVLLLTVRRGKVYVPTPPCSGITLLKGIPLLDGLIHPPVL